MESSQLGLSRGHAPATDSRSTAAGVDVAGGGHVRPRAQVPPVAGAARLPHMVDGDGLVRVLAADVLQDLELVGLLDLLYPPHCLLLAHLQGESALCGWPVVPVSAVRCCIVQVALQAHTCRA